MVDLTTLQPLYAAEGPYATVYLEGRSPGDDASQQVRLRWNDLREQLHTAGADDASLEALEERVLDSTPGEMQTDGRVLVAAGGSVLLEEAWDAALGTGDRAHWGDDPELGAWVRERDRAVRMLVAIVDQNSAVVRHEVVAEQHAQQEQAEQHVEGSSVEDVHQPREGALAHRTMQRRAEEAVQQNARDIAAHLDSAAKSFVPDVLVLAGETQGRTAVADALSEKLGSICTQVERGGTDDDRAEQVLADELRELASQETDRRMRETAERLQQAQAHHLAVVGAEQVAAAARMAAVETLLLAPEPTANEGSLLRACAQEGGAAALADADMTDGVGAILRFATTTEGVPT